MSIQALHNIRRVVVLVESRQQLDFFLRFKVGLKKLNMKLVFVTDKPSLYLESFFLHHVTTCLVRSAPEDFEVPDLSSTVEICSQKIFIDHARKLYRAVFQCLSQQVLGDQQTIFFVWGGNSVASTAVWHVAQKHDAGVLFFDRGNIPGKYFVDPWGTNLQSYLYHHPHVLDHPSAPELIHTSINESNQCSVWKTLSLQMNLLFFADILYSWFVGLPFRGDKNIFMKIFHKARPQVSRHANQYIIDGAEYYLIVLPHSYEIKKHHIELSSVSETILNILVEAMKGHLDVVIKFHPDEDDDVFVKTLVGLKIHGPFYVVMGSIRDLVKHAREVFLFNSSVALETIIQKKIYHFVQPSFFEQFTLQRAANYVHNYLIAPEVDHDGFFVLTTVQQVLHRVTIL